MGSTQGMASGPCSFLKIYNTSTEVMKQGGTRRGANMGMLRVDHPDILEFIGLKEKDGTINNFNLSVALTDEFMEAVEKNGDFGLRFEGRLEGESRRGPSGTGYGRCVAQRRAGGLFIDRANEANPTPRMGASRAPTRAASSPCCPSRRACSARSIFRRWSPRKGRSIGTCSGSTVRTGARMLDNIIDKQDYPLPEVEEMHKSNRKIGLGVMGWADMLIRCAINYASEEALTLAEGVMSFVTGRR